MGTLVHTGLISQVVRHLPASLVSVLDAWSHRIARRRARERMRKWEQRQAPAARPEPETRYHLKPWRD
jgi:DNA-directed RNA polymerase specialized sigma24 family protein